MKPMESSPWPAVVQDAVSEQQAQPQSLTVAQVHCGAGCGVPAEERAPSFRACCHILHTHVGSEVKESLPSPLGKVRMLKGERSRWRTWNLFHAEGKQTNRTLWILR